jgi:hypothetical protein
MRLLDNLRHAERKGVNAVRRGMERARDEWGDVERRIRQRMRVYPQKLKTSVMPDEADIEHQGHLAGSGLDAEPEQRKPIVSIHGHDVHEEELDKPAA